MQGLRASDKREKNKYAVLMDGGWRALSTVVPVGVSPSCCAIPHVVSGLRILTPFGYSLVFSLFVQAYRNCIPRDLNQQ
jgi:hypothetical protein